MNKENKTTVAMLPTGWRMFAILIGCLFIAIGLTIYICPPERLSTETSNSTAPAPASAHKTTSISADPEHVVLALMIGGGILLIYGINGKAITRFSSKFVEMDTDEPSDSEASKLKETTGGTSVASAAAPTPTPQQATPEIPHGYVNALDVIKFSMGRASWNGLKVLYSCQIAHQKNITFNLRDLCVRDKIMSYDYAYGYLVAASSVGILLHSADNTGTHITVNAFYEVVSVELASEIEKRVRADASDSVNKRGQLDAIQSFLG